MTAFHPLLKSALLVSTCLGLASCKSLVSKPSMIPSGYTYHTQPYKSPPPAMADDIGYTFNAGKNAEVIAMFRPKVEQLVMRLEQDGGFSNADFYVRVPVDGDVQMATFDHVLREVLIERGHRIISDQYKGTILTYTIIDPEEMDKDYMRAIYNRNDSPNPHPPAYHDGSEYKDMLLTLSVIGPDGPATGVSGAYTIPMYGYDPVMTVPLIRDVAGQKSIGVYDEREMNLNE